MESMLEQVSLQREPKIEEEYQISDAQTAIYAVQVQSRYAHTPQTDVQCAV